MEGTGRAEEQGFWAKDNVLSLLPLLATGVRSVCESLGRHTLVISALLFMYTTLQWNVKNIFNIVMTYLHQLFRKDG